METSITIPQTLHAAMKHFADPQVAHNFLVALRWPDGVTCPYCAGREHSFISTRKVWACKSCGKRFSVRVGTVMEDSPLPTDVWLAGMFLIANAKNGISSCEVSRALGITQKSAWFLLHRIRLVMQTGSIEKLSGEVEVDEAAFGGIEKFKHQNKRLKVGGGTGGKEIVVGFKQRDGEVRTKHIANTTKDTLHGEVKANVEAGSEVYTDTAQSYKGLEADYTHGRVNHNIGQYVKDKASTNQMENVWSVYKRAVKGSYIHVSPQHLSRYLAEFDYRFNNRELNDGGRFATAVAQSAGKRLTYDQLVTESLETIDRP